MTGVTGTQSPPCLAISRSTVKPAQQYTSLTAHGHDHHRPRRRRLLQTERRLKLPADVLRKASRALETLARSAQTNQRHRPPSTFWTEVAPRLAARDRPRQKYVFARRAPGITSTDEYYLDQDDEENYSDHDIHQHPPARKKHTSAKFDEPPPPHQQLMSRRRHIL